MSNLSQERVVAQYIEDVNPHIFSPKKVVQVVQVGRMSHVQPFPRKGCCIDKTHRLGVMGMTHTGDTEEIWAFHP